MNAQTFLCRVADMRTGEENPALGFDDGYDALNRLILEARKIVSEQQRGNYAKQQ